MNKFAIILTIYYIYQSILNIMEKRNYKVLYFTIISTFFISSSFAQLLTSNGAKFFTANGSLIQINGTARIIGNTFTNNGQSIITGDFVNDGTTNGNGSYLVSGDWYNNSVFNCGSSSVFLVGNTQLIRGTQVSIFNNLTLDGVPASIKSQSINSTVSNTLDLKDHELATGTFVMLVNNTNTNAIQRTTGFVSSVGIGRLSRMTNSNNAYLFPVGSSAPAIIYRPIDITPSSIAVNIYSAALVNSPAPSLNNDDSLCLVNPNFYHLIDRNGATTANIKSYYISAIDGTYNSIAHWNSTPIPEWHITDLNNITGNIAPFDFASTSVAWNSFATDSFILAKRGPIIKNLSGLKAICDSSQTAYTVNGPAGANYSWNVNGGTIINAPNSNNSIDVVWTNPNGAHDITAQYLTPGCNSNLLTFNITVNPKPLASFTYNPNSNLNTNELINFLNGTTGGVDYTWNFGDSISTTNINPYHEYENGGNYFVTLISTNQFGCKDTSRQQIYIPGDLQISNVFTPNGDGYNDYFKIRNAGSDYRLLIYDRWGSIVFDNQNNRAGWDGRTAAGNNAPSGTYYYVVTFNTNEGTQNKRGSLTLIR